MFNQPVAPSRRTVLRAAAWTAPAVSIAVAAPAYATSHPDLQGTVTVVGDAVKYSNGNVKNVRWSIRITNNGSTPLENVWVDFSFTDSSGAAVTSFTVTSATGSWSVTSLAELTAAYNGSIPVGGSVTFTAVFTGATNASGSVGAAVYDGSTLLGSPVSGSF